MTCIKLESDRTLKFCQLQAPLLGTLWAAIIIWLVRLAAIFLGSWLGAYMGGSTVEHRRRIWQGMITQVRLATWLEVGLVYVAPGRDSLHV